MMISYLGIMKTVPISTRLVFLLILLLPLMVLLIVRFNSNTYYGEIERVEFSWGRYILYKRSELAEPNTKEYDFYEIIIEHNITTLDALEKYFSYRHLSIETYLNFDPFKEPELAYLSCTIIFRTFLSINEFQSFFSNYLYKYGGIIIVSVKNGSENMFFLDEIFSDWEQDLGIIHYTKEDFAPLGILKVHGYLKEEKFKTLLANQDILGIETFEGDSYLLELSQKYKPSYITWKGLPLWEIYASLQYNL
ncbi:MAG: hypothetical protein ACFFDT_01895 [Candidatus Hodarchaeota archaeon]